MVFDAFLDKFDCAAVFTNDTDFTEPIRRVRHELNKKVYIVPTVIEGHRKPNMELIKAATDYYFITEEMLSNCQLPQKLIDSKGRPIHKPPEW